MEKLTNDLGAIKHKQLPNGLSAFWSAAILGAQSNCIKSKKFTKSFKSRIFDRALEFIEHPISTQK